MCRREQERIEIKTAKEAPNSPTIHRPHEMDMLVSLYVRPPTSECLAVFWRSGRHAGGHINTDRSHGLQHFLFFVSFITRTLLCSMTFTNYNYFYTPSKHLNLSTACKNELSHAFLFCFTTSRGENYVLRQYDPIGFSIISMSVSSVVDHGLFCYVTKSE